MTDLIQEIRVRRAEAKARQARGEGMADGWTEQHVDALLAEIDRVERVNEERLDLLAEEIAVLRNEADGVVPAERERGDQMVEETINRAATLVPPEMQQWFVDEMHGVKRVGGKVV